MKRNTSIAIIIISLLFLVVFQFFTNSRQVNRLKRQMLIETAKTDFILREQGIQNVSFDSVYANNDTISFYKNDSLVGKTVIVTE